MTGDPEAGLGRRITLDTGFRGNDEGVDVEPGIYAYEVTVTQDVPQRVLVSPDGASTTWPAYDDEATDRSTFLSVGRSRDENEESIFEADYDAYDDKGTPEEDDDDYLYIIRYYTLTDYGNIDATAGVLKLYDPDMQLKEQWDLGALEDLEEPDSLTATQSGVDHAVRVPVPVSAMGEGGTYRFVAQVVDDHAAGYRDHHSNRPALDLNARMAVALCAVFCTDDSGSQTPNKYDDTPYGETAYDFLWEVFTGHGSAFVPGYVGRSPLGSPELGGSGVCVNKGSRLAIRTLNRLCPTELGTIPQAYATKNAVWAFYGHAKPATLTFAGTTYITREYPDNPAAEVYNIGQFDLHHVKLAYLSGCGTAGGNLQDEPGYNVPQSQSIAQSFRNQGCQAVVGFWNYARRGTWFRSFNSNFWRYACRGIIEDNGTRRKVSVKKAVREALARVPYASRLSSNRPEVRVFGDAYLHPVP